MIVFPSTIIISPNPDLLLQKINELCKELENIVSPNNPDIFNIGPLSGWGIDIIREINFFLSKKPIQHRNKIVLISDAQNLQTEAQNALLKNLEEPGTNNYFILTANNSSALLSTITSRCKIIRIKKTLSVTSQESLIITGNPSVDLLTSEKIAQNKDSILPFMEEQIVLLQKKLAKNPSKETSTQIQKVIKAISMIKSNVDPKSALDYIMLV